MESTVGFYEEMSSLWDFVFENSQPTIKELSRAVHNYLNEKVDGFEDSMRVCGGKRMILPTGERATVGV